MTKLFYKKSTSILVIAAILVLVLLALILLVTLMQMSSLSQRAEKLAELIAKAQEDEANLQELIDYLETDDYVRKWAEENNRIKGDDIIWLEEKIPSNSDN